MDDFFFRWCCFFFASVGLYLLRKDEKENLRMGFRVCFFPYITYRVLQFKFMFVTLISHFNYNKKNCISNNNVNFSKGQG